MKTCWVVSNLTFDYNCVMLKGRVLSIQLFRRDASSSIDAFCANVAVLAKNSNFVAVFELCAH